MKNYDFRMYKLSELPILNQEHKQNIINNIGNDLYTNRKQKKELKLYLLQKVSKFKCPYCGFELELAASEEVDHFIPKNDDNKNDVNNLVLSCRNCNNSKRDFVPDEKLYPYGVEISNLLMRDCMGKIIPAIDDAHFNEFCDKMKFKSTRQSYVYITLLITAILESDINLDETDKNCLYEIYTTIKKYAKYYELSD